MDGDNFGDGRHQERRRHRPAGQSPMDILRQLPALVVLERMPVPVLAVGDDGTILFANAAFSQMLGHPAEAVARKLIEQGKIDRDGSTVRATMSPSALLRADDTVALATFHDRTEELWLQDR